MENQLWNVSLQGLYGNQGSDLSVRHKPAALFTALAAEELILWLPHRLFGLVFLFHLDKHGVDSTNPFGLVA
jgi:hypothetical protein